MGYIHCWTFHWGKKIYRVILPPLSFNSCAKQQHENYRCISKLMHVLEINRILQDCESLHNRLTGPQLAEVCDTAEEVRRRELSLRNTSAQDWTSTEMTNSACHSLFGHSVLQKVEIEIWIHHLSKQQGLPRKGTLIKMLWIHFRAHSETFGTFDAVAFTGEPSVLMGQEKRFA